MKNYQLIAEFEKAYQEGFGYIWGTSGQTWSTEKQKNLEQKYNSDKEKYYNYKMGALHGKKWIGKKVADCSGLFVWAYKNLSREIYHGSNTIWKSYCVNKGQLKNGLRSDGQEIRPGSAVFKTNGSNRHHIGLYIGNGEVIEAKSTFYGVVKSPIKKWDEIAELKGVDYEEGGNYTVLKFGDTGEAVKQLQKNLNNIMGAAIKEDGIFGHDTKNLVKLFQAYHDLETDGVVGPLTEKEIEKELTQGQGRDSIIRDATKLLEKALTMKE